MVGWALSARLDPPPSLACSLLTLSRPLTPALPGVRAQSSQPILWPGFQCRDPQQSLPPLLGPRKKPPVHALGKMLSILCLMGDAVSQEKWGWISSFPLKNSIKLGIFVHVLCTRRPVFSWAFTTPGLDSGSRKRAQWLARRYGYDEVPKVHWSFHIRAMLWSGCMFAYRRPLLVYGRPSLSVGWTEKCPRDPRREGEDKRKRGNRAIPATFNRHEQTCN